MNVNTGFQKKSKRKIRLTKDIDIDDGSHILYFYQSEDTYIQNAVSYILSAIEFNQKVVFIDTEKNFQRVVSELNIYISEKAIDNLLEYINNYDFYEMYQDFHFERVLDNFNHAIKYYVDNNINIRVWGHVDWKRQNDIDAKLHCYETEADLAINEIGYMTVCAYNSRKVQAYIQTELMKSHEFFMIDDQLVRSNLYNTAQGVVFPSISAERKIKSELDFYKRKLDFIHVVSHEVRNPLTVIKAYAILLKEKLLDEIDKQHLQLIADYSDAIDYEIHHIIQTEQMLTTDSLWKTKLIKVYPIIEDVIRMMDIKARTQNIRLTCMLTIPENLIIKGNSIGMRLVISNIIDNAIKYSDEGMEVVVKVYHRDNQFVFEVIDNGVGMTEEQKQKLFYKYERGNESKPGQGIGLFMVKNIIDYFKGCITVESEPNYGSRFIITLPI